MFRKQTDVASKGTFVGTSGWSYATWKPDFYPQAFSAKRFLEYYASKLNSVEVNYTFSRVPTDKMLAEWLDVTGEAFRFSFKAPQRITHHLRLRDCAEALCHFRQVLAPVIVSSRMGVVLFQLAPNLKRDLPLLTTFLGEAEQLDLRMSFEFRHETWFCDEVFEILQRHDAALCVAQSDDLQTPDVTTASFAYYRLRQSGYSSAQLDDVAKTLRRRAADGEAFAYFKHEEKPAAALRAMAMLDRLGS